ncbi:hypothetical protein [Caldalkalibacillus mannanilyticus]|uniref:hypothetical protein n=1 Tax=Caldalkalibacillus mannanilyticus TaxID=1418 RepID=UPI0004689E27|nr:hypothetical protein [Caldalkalibacillus mannanilyticus]
MPYDNVKASPTYLPFQTNITYDVATVATTYFISTGIGSAFGALSGYVLNNASSTGDAQISLLKGTAVLGTPFSVAPGQYQSFFAVGADAVQVVTTAAGDLATGELHMVFNANPM